MPDLIIVSACLAGIHCRYDGNSNKNDDIGKMVLSGRALPLCPEVLGGLETPRIPCEIIYKNDSSQVVGQQGEDFTRFFQLGAEKTLAIALLIGAKTAILQSRSPSCGLRQIYDGSFTGKLVKGNGLTAELLEKNGLKVLTDANFHSRLGLD